MLFSEPKIPQSVRVYKRYGALFCFSALQRAENSSIRSETVEPPGKFRVSVLFSEPKIPQFSFDTTARTGTGRFSALQRAENSSIWLPSRRTCPPSRFSALQRAENSSIHPPIRSTTLLDRFQCSSASRKFLNRDSVIERTRFGLCFSALQRAENSSIADASSRRSDRARFSALQRAENSSIHCCSNTKD